MENRKIKSRCIFIYQDKVLLCYNEEHNYYFFPGGSQDKDESAKDTLQREILEEFGSHIENTKTLGVMENVGQDLDETITMFQANFSDLAIYKQSQIPLLDMPEIKAVWVKLEDVKNEKIKIFPEYDYLKFIR